MKSGLMAIRRSCFCVLPAIRYLALTAGILGTPEGVHPQTVPPGFVIENAFPTAVFDKPVQIVFLPDGRKFVVEFPGRVWVLTPSGTQLPTPFIDLTAKIPNRADWGLIGVAIDPDFVINKWVYFLYVADPDSNPATVPTTAFSRVERYQASASNPDVADISSRQILIGSDWSNGIPAVSSSGSHVIGTLRFGHDKSLFIGSGDAAAYQGVDSGGRDPDAFGPGKTDSTEDIGAFRAQSLNSYDGKILRVDKETGLGLSNNPYYDGNPASVRSRVWVYGLRNPFRFAVRPELEHDYLEHDTPGTLYIGEVGWFTYEELNIARTGGVNYGWPVIEGPQAQPLYTAVTSTFYPNPNVLATSAPNPENPAPRTNPDLWWHHSNGASSQPTGWVGNSATGGTFYEGVSYPTRYHNSFILADYGQNWIRSMQFDASDNLIPGSDTILVSNAAGPVSIETDPVSGDIFYISIYQSKVFRIRYPTGNLRPLVVASGAPTYGLAPLQVQFAASGSVDPDGDTLSTVWKFGNGDSALVADTSYTYTAEGAYTASVTVSDGKGGVADTAFLVVVGQVPPLAQIADLPDTSVFVNNDMVPVTAFPVDTSSIPASYRWDIDFLHNNHIHPSWLVLVGRTASFVASTPHGDGESYGFRIRLSVTQGYLTTRDTVVIVPGPTPPNITLHPASQPVSEGQSATFSVDAGGTPPFSYQWQKNNLDIAGATGSSYTTPFTTLSDSGTLYRCIVTNSVGADTSNQATLAVIGGYILSDDFSTPVLNPLRWTFINPGAPSTLTFVGTGTANARLAIIVPGGSAHDIWTEGNNAPRIMQPVSNPDNFLIEVRFEAPMTAGYQIEGIIVQQDPGNFLRFGFVRNTSNTRLFAASFTNGVPTTKHNITITGGTQLYLRLQRAGSVWTQSYSYDGNIFTAGPPFAHDLNVSSIGPYIGNAGFPSITTPAFTGLIDYFLNLASPFSPAEDPVPPEITTQPANTSVVTGQTATFSVVATGTAALSYQWQKNNTDIAGAVASSFTTTTTVAADSNSTYRCIVTNAFGADTSNTATLTVTAGMPPEIITQPVDRLVTVGQTATFSIVAAGSPVLSYQWKKDTANVNGATSPTYTTPVTVAADSGLIFRCIVTNEFGTATSNGAALSVQAPPPAVFSDDFSGGTIDSRWNFVNPRNDASVSLTGTGTNDARLSIMVPGGVSHDLWTGGAFAPRLLQNVTNTDFEVLLKFESVMNAQYQLNGLIVQQDPTNYLRFDFVRYSTSTRIFAASIVNNVATTRSTIAITAAPILHLRVRRVGNVWTSWHSANGTAWTQAANFSHTITVRHVGPFAGNAGSPAPAFTSRVDYFFNALAPISPEDPLAPVPASFTMHPVNQIVSPGQTATFTVTAIGSTPLSYQWEKNGVDIPGALASSYTTPGVILSDSGSMFRCRVTNPLGADTSDAAVLSVRLGTDASGIFSDNFNDPGGLNTSLWTFVNPRGDVTLGMTGGTLSMALPAGVSHDAWSGGNTAPHILQNANSTNFQVEAKFTSTMNAQYQNQGILVQQNSANYVRFDFVRSSTATRIYSATIINNTATQKSNITITAGNPLYLRVKRTGNTWTSYYSYNGTTWTTAANYSHTLTVTKVGLFFGNAGSPTPSFTGVADYFFNTAFPAVPTLASGAVISEEAPVSFSLEANYPNPFNPSTTIRFALPVDSHVSLKLFNTMGQEIRTLVDDVRGAGVSTVEWDGRQNDGGPAASGVYFCRIEANAIDHPDQSFTSVRKMVLLK